MFFRNDLYARVYTIFRAGFKFGVRFSNLELLGPFCPCFASPKAQALFTSSLALSSPRLGGIAFANAANNASSCCSAFANAHAVFAKCCGTEMQFRLLGHRRKPRSIPLPRRCQRERSVHEGLRIELAETWFCCFRQRRKQRLILLLRSRKRPRILFRWGSSNLQKF